MHVIEAIELYYDQHGRNVKSAHNIRSAIAVFKTMLRGERLTELSVADLATSHLFTFADWFAVKRRPGTVRNYMVCFRTALNHHRRRGVAMPARHELEWPRIKTPKRLRHLSQAEEDALLADLKGITERRGSYRSIDQYHLAIVLLETGARVGEISRLKWDDVKLDESMIIIHRKKTEHHEGSKTIARLKVSQKVVDVLSTRFLAREANVPWVFVNDDTTGPRNTNNVGLRRALKKHAPGAVVHSLRHTFATKMLDKGLPLGDISSMLGHTNAAQTLTYAHFVPEAASARAKVLLDGGLIEAAEQHVAGQIDDREAAIALINNNPEIVAALIKVMQEVTVDA